MSYRIAVAFTLNFKNMNTYSLGDKVKINGKTGTITQIFAGDDGNTYEITFKDGSTCIEFLF